MSRLTAKSLSVALGGRPVLHDVTCDLPAGEFVALVGPNGAGKSTLLRCLAGLLTPDAGSVSLEGTPLASIPPRIKAQRLAYLPQGGEAVWPIAVHELVMLGRLPYRKPFARPSRADVDAVDRALAAMHVEALADRHATELSGGERARVLLARALAGEPDLLLADEPAAGLDPYHAIDVMERFKALAEAGTAVLIVLHDLTLAARFCGRILLLHEGRIAQDGPPASALAPDRIAEVYGVEAVAGRHGGEPYILPWRRL